MRRVEFINDLLELLQKYRAEIKAIDDQLVVWFENPHFDNFSLGHSTDTVRKMTDEKRSSMDERCVQEPDEGRSLHTSERDGQDERTRS